MKIFLVGFMGVGKTTIGTKLAEALGYRFVDLDKIIEEKEQMKIAEIFSAKGEEYFRNLEKDTYFELVATMDMMVMATGGGTPCFFNLIDDMNKQGRTVYLKASVQTLVQRNEADSNQRPLLSDSKGADLENKIEDMLQYRASCYEKAHHTVEINHFSLEKSLTEIIKLFI
ncbi:MAG: shikimate kinase [Flavobacteriales bacterium]